MKKRILNRILFVALFALAIIAVVNVHVDATGYTYDHKNKVIYSTEGFTVNQTPYIYETLGIKATSFTEENPTDLFVYSADDMGASDLAIDDTIVYMLDSGGANKDATLYVFDSSLKLHREVFALRYNPNTIKGSIEAFKSQKSLIVTSHKAATTYTVTFVDPLAEGDAATLGAVKVVSGKAASPVIPADHEGYYFNGWDTEFSNVTSDITVTAKYAKIEDAQAAIDAENAKREAEGMSPVEAFKTFTVKYIDGVTSAVLGQYTVKKGDYVVLPQAAEKDGYECEGWNNDGKTEVKSSVIVKSQYKKIHTVTFVDSKNDNAVISTVKVANGNSATAPFVPYYDNYYLTGWDKEFSNVTSDLTVATVYKSYAELQQEIDNKNAQIDIDNAAIDEAIALLTEESEKQALEKTKKQHLDDFFAYTITYVDGVNGDVIRKVNVKAGDTTPLPASSNTNTVYTFNGWYLDGNAVTKGVEVKSDLTFTASYSKKTNGIELADLYGETEMYLYMAGSNSVYRGVAKNISPYTDYIYICDTGNSQILVIDAKSYEETEAGKGTYELVQVITSPISEIGSASFSPLKAVNDAAGRVYAICEGIEDGILEFSKSGSFDRYVGTNYVTLSAWEIFTRNFATEAQLDQFTTYQNTTFTSMVYKNNMIYTTSYSIKNSNGSINDTIMIKKINPSGKDVLRRNGYNKPKGDITYTQYNDDNGAYGTSQFVGITVNEYGVYTVVDNKRGRLFTYDNEGNLLYISGGSGAQLDKINIPIAVQYLGENILVLDSKRKAIIVFEPTDIAKVINKAIQCEYNGQSEAAYEYWEDVIQLNANYEHAYVGIGKHYMEATEIEDNYKIAMENFELGANPIYYSKAYKQYRDAKIKAWFPWVAGTLIVVVVGGVVFKKVRRKKLGIKEEEMTGMGDE